MTDTKVASLDARRTQSLPSATIGWPERSMPSKLSRAAEWLADGGPWPPDVKADDIDVRAAEALRISLIDALRPAPAARIIQLLTGLMLHFPRPDFSQEQAKMVCMDMAQDFAELPLDIFEEACRAWRQTEKWFPRTAELLAKAQALLAVRKSALRDVQRVLAALTKPAKPKDGENFTGFDEAAEEARIQTYLAGLAERCRHDTPDRGPSDYANPVRPWNRPGWVPNPKAPKLADPEGNDV